VLSVCFEQQHSFERRVHGECRCLWDHSFAVVNEKAFLIVYRNICENCQILQRFPSPSHKRDFSVAGEVTNINKYFGSQLNSIYSDSAKVILSISY